MKAIKSRSIPLFSLHRGIIATFVAALYCVTTLAAPFPGFHNHRPLLQHGCCENAHTCGTNTNFSGELRAAANDAARSHSPCMACLWQALAKRDIKAVTLAGLLIDSAGARFYSPPVAEPATLRYRFPQTRAPPLT